MTGRRGLSLLLSVVVVLSMVAPFVGVVTGNVGPESAVQSGAAFDRSAMDGSAVEQVTSGTLVVDKSDPQAYDSIQSAVDDASDGDTVEVRPGTYEDSLRLTEDVTIVAPEGATLANGSSTATPVGVSISEDASPTLSGLTLTGWRWSIGAWRGDGDWTLRDSRIEGGESAVAAGDTTGAWTIENVTITGARNGVEAYSSTGAWTIRNSVFTNNSEDGVDAYSSTGAWTIRNSVFTNNSEEGIEAVEANGTWTVRDTTIRGSEDGHGIAGYDTSGEWHVTNVTISDVVRGISVDGSVGDWTVERTTVRDSYVGLDTYETTGNWTARDIVMEGSKHGVNAYNTSGNWVVRNATVLGSNSNGIIAENSAGQWVVRDSTVKGGYTAVTASRSSEQWTIRNTTLDAPTGVNATDAVVAGDAAYNYWGTADGPSGDFPGSGAAAVGNVSVEPFYTDEALTTLDTFDDQPPSSDLVVDTTDSDAYDSIQTAVDDASEGDRVEVRPGTYTESVVIRKNITLVAPDGATVQNASVDYPAGIQVFGSVTPTIEGFTIEGWRVAFSAGPSQGAWTLRDTVIRDSENGIGAAGTPAPWTVENVTVVDTETGLSAYASSGDWVIRDSTFSGEGSSISADESTGDWTIEGTTIRNVTDAAVNARRSSGRWTIANTTLLDNADGVSAEGSTNDWTVRDSVISNTANDGIAAGETSGDWALVNVTVFDVDDDAVDAYNSDGDWIVRNTTVTDASGDSIKADSSTGDWKVYDTVVTGTDNAVNGINAGNSAGNWTARDVVIEGGEHGINTWNSSGDWTARDVVIEGGEHGIDTWAASGNWVVRNATVLGSNANGIHAGNSTGRWLVRDSRVEGGDAAVFALRSSEQWTVRNTTLDAPVGVNATDAVVAGDAAYNYWGSADGPSGDFPGSGEPAVGNVSVEPFYTDEALTTLGTFDDQPGTLVVGADDPGAYDSIQAAVDAADEGETVEVRPDSYAESVTLDENVTVVAPAGATLDGDGVAEEDGFVIPAGSAAAPTVENVSVVNFSTGVDAAGSTGDWTVRNVDVRGANSAERGSLSVAGATMSHGDTGSVGVDAAHSEGAWTLRSATLSNNAVGVRAVDTGGAWTVTESVIVDNDVGLNATGASVAGNATRNYWGASDGPGGTLSGGGDPVVGNVEVASFYTDRSKTTRSSSSDVNVDARLVSSANNVDAPVEVEVSTVDPDGTVEELLVLDDTGTVLDRADCDGSNCTATLSTTPDESTWNGSGYGNRTYHVVANGSAGTVASDSVSTQVAIAGDGNRDGRVNIFDAVAVGGAWQSTRGEGSYSAKADLNNDGRINIFDAVAIGRNWQSRAS